MCDVQMWSGSGYFDPLVFVDVGKIVTSYSLVQGVSAGGTIAPDAGGSSLGSNATVGGFGTYMDLTSSPSGMAYL